ncbi:MAG TPA: peptidylprolyl isomerase [Gemmatales bacterium]|nr:peptidylprolyl isomerase [Gemmatales bacterium]
MKSRWQPHATLLLIACLFGLVPVACQRAADTPAATSATPSVPANVSSRPVPDGSPNPTPPAPLPFIPQVMAAGAVVPEPQDSDWLNQPFAEATAAEPPPNALPPLRTLAGKSVGKIATEVQSLWPQIRFQAATASSERPQVLLHTAQGPIRIELWTDVAPNHCRSFLALVQAGYYDGLRFEARLGDPNLPGTARAVSAGSPEGDAQPLASVGYWLRPEILSDAEAERRQVRHVRGLVGAVRAFDQPDSASCQFYVCLEALPERDGQYTLFGRVVTGLEALDALHDQPLIAAGAPPWLFQTPLVITRAESLRRN